MKTVVLIALVFLSLPAAWAENTFDLFPYAQETDRVIFVDKKTGEQRSELDYSLKVSGPPGERTFEFSRLGRGKCDRYVNIIWETSARLKEKNGFLQLRDSSCVAKDPQGGIILRYEKICDYERKTITWRQLDAQGAVRKEARFPIKGPTTDDVTLMYFLKTYAANRHRPGFQSYYFLSNEPRLYKVNIKVMGTETLRLPIGERKAVKLKLTGDMGIVDDILDRYVPHTYVWFEDVPPYEWLQYEGLETSMQSANVKAFVTQRSRK